MTAGIFATSGARLYIGGVISPKNSDFVSGDFSGQSWVEVNWLENLGQFGDQSSNIKFDAIKDKRTHKLKGNRDAGDMAIICGIDYSDLGQIALRAAEETPYNYAFKVEFNDMPSGGTTNSLRYFLALVMDSREQLDTANNVMKLTATLGVNSNVVKVYAS